MRVLIINLTRFGDLLQTQPIIHAFHDSGYEVGLLCLENFASAGKLLEDVSTLLALPGARLLSTLDTNWQKSAAILYQFIDSLWQRFPADIILNLTSSTGARLLTHLLSDKKEVRGFSVDDQGFSNNSTLWAAFFEASTRKRGCSPYNIVDSFRKASGVGNLPARFALRRPSQEKMQKMTSLLAEQSNNAPGYVAFQLGASEERRRWDTSRFAELGRRIYTTFGFMPVLLGTAQEQRLAKEYFTHNAPGIDLLGKTSLDELAAVLNCCRLLVTNDTGTMHLAAGLGVPCLAMFFATAQPCDTGPYLQDCCCLEPALPCHPCGFGTTCTKNNACRDQITIELLWSLIQERFHTGHWPKSIAAENLSRVWLTVRDAEGFLDLKSLSGHDQEKRSIWLRLQRHYYRQFLDMIDAESLQNCRQSDPIAGTKFLPLSAKDQALVKNLPQKAAFQNKLQELHELCLFFVQQGKFLLSGKMPQAGKRFLSTSQRINSILEDGDQDGAFDALGRLWMVATHERGGDIQAVINFAKLFGQMADNWAKSLEK